MIGLKIYAFEVLSRKGKSRLIKVKCLCGKEMCVNLSKLYDGFYRDCGCGAARIESDSSVLDFEDARRNKYLMSKYGITIWDYLEMMKIQNNSCAICGKGCWVTGNSGKYPFYVDHNHLTGKVRGLLCAKCNNGLGAFEDNINYLSRAADYLSRG